jgi:hypothetical protein
MPDQLQPPLIRDACPLEEFSSSVRAVDFEAIVFGRDFGILVGLAEIVEDGGHGLDFGVAVGEGKLRCDGFEEKEGAEHVVVSYVVHVLAGEGECGGYEEGVWDSDAGEKAGWSRHCGVLVRRKLLMESWMNV